MQSSLKTTLPPQHNSHVRTVLENAGFTFSDHEHAFWRAKKGSQTIIFYHKGTLLFQGDSSTGKLWIESFTGSTPTAKPKETESSLNFTNETIMGLDESGKGDYFGPLVMAAAIVNPDTAVRLTKAGVMDSKKVSESGIKRLFEEMKSLIRYKVRLIGPKEYNTLYDRHLNLNHLLVEEYRLLIGGFETADYDRVVLDRFSASDSQNNQIRMATSKPIIIEPRGERNIAVAAASIIARYHFTEWIDAASRRMGFQIPLGSGPESRRLFNQTKTNMSEEDFRTIAKTHFKS